MITAESQQGIIMSINLSQESVHQLGVGWTLRLTESHADALSTSSLSFISKVGVYTIPRRAAVKWICRGEV